MKVSRRVGRVKSEVVVNGKAGQWKANTQAGRIRYTVMPCASGNVGDSSGRGPELNARHAPGS